MIDAADDLFELDVKPGGQKAGRKSAVRKAQPQPARAPRPVKEGFTPSPPATQPPPGSPKAKNRVPSTRTKKPGAGLVPPTRTPPPSTKKAAEKAGGKPKQQPKSTKGTNPETWEV